MKKITLEKTHALLEKLAEYVMTEVASKREVNELKTEVDELKFDVSGLKIDVSGLKSDVKNLNKKVDTIITVQDNQAKQLDDIKTEQIAFHAALLRHEKRITHLER